MDHGNWRSVPIRKRQGRQQPQRQNRRLREESGGGDLATEENAVNITPERMQQMVGTSYRRLRKMSTTAYTQNGGLLYESFWSQVLTDKAREMSSCEATTETGKVRCVIHLVALGVGDFVNSPNAEAQLALFLTLRDVLTERNIPELNKSSMSETISFTLGNVHFFEPILGQSSLVGTTSATSSTPDGDRGAVVSIEEENNEAKKTERSFTSADVSVEILRRLGVETLAHNTFGTYWLQHQQQQQQVSDTKGSISMGAPRNEKHFIVSYMPKCPKQLYHNFILSQFTNPVLLEGKGDLPSTTTTTTTTPSTSASASPSSTETEEQKQNESPTPNHANNVSVLELTRIESLKFKERLQGSDAASSFVIVGNNLKSYLDTSIYYEPSASSAKKTGGGKKGASSRQLLPLNMLETFSDVSECRPLFKTARGSIEKPWQGAPTTAVGDLAVNSLRGDAVDAAMKSKLLAECTAGGKKSASLDDAHVDTSLASVSLPLSYIVKSGEELL